MILLRVLSLLMICILATVAKQLWLKPGCHRVGNTRLISIPDCVEFKITTNACRGFCESYAVPSLTGLTAMVANGFRPPKPVVSVGQCCNMMESEDIHKRVFCMDGMRNFTFKSAVTCSCYHCQKE